MEVILLERVPNLGNMGDIVTVKGGFARNFLLPQSKALPATKANLATYEERRKQLETDNSARRVEAEKLAKTLDGVSVSLERQASETGQLYGSVKSSDLQKALTTIGHAVPKGSVELSEPIKTVGDYTAIVTLHPEVTFKLPVAIRRQVL